MLTALMVLSWLIAAFLAIIVLFLALPLRLRLSFQSDPAMRFFIVVWPFGGVFFPLRIFDSTRRQLASAKKKPRKKPDRTRRSRAIRAGAIRQLPTALGQMVSAVHIEKLHIDAEFGLRDPADTGIIYGQLTPLIYAVGGDITLRPNFSAACLRGAAELSGRVIPIVFLWPVVGLLWHAFGPAR